MPDSPPPPEPTLQSHMARGSTWTIGIRWFVRTSGLISTIILARLLTPADYGIITISMIIVGTVEVFSQTGQHLAIIRMKNPTRDHYDSAFSVQIILHSVLSAVILLLIPLSTIYFHEPRARWVIAIFASRSLVAGFENIGVLNFRRDLRFDRQFRYTAIPELISFVVTIAGGFYFRNYWALVIGIMVQQLTTTVLSYVLEPYRPRLSFEKVREIWSFSFWTLARSIGTYLNGQVGKIAIGGFAGTASVGQYYVGLDIASSPVHEIVDPINIVLFPVLSRAQDDKAKRRELFLDVFYWTALICVSTSVGVAVVGRDLVNVVLGRQWTATIPLIPWFSLAAGVLAMTSSVYYSFETIGRPKTSAQLQWLRLAILVAVLFPIAYTFHSILAVAIARFFVTLFFAPTLFLALGRALDVSPASFTRLAARPLAAGLFMAMVVLGLNLVGPGPGPVRLALDVIAGTVSYCGLLVAFWILLGRPPGPESTIYIYVVTLFAALRTRLAGHAGPTRPARENE